MEKVQNAVKENIIFYKNLILSSIPANSARLGRGYLFVQPMEAFKSGLKTIIIFDPSSTETTRKGVKMQHKRKEKNQLFPISLLHPLGTSSI